MPQPTVSAEMKSVMADVTKRYEFNVGQIEQRYCNKSTGLVFNVENDDVSRFKLKQGSVL